MRNLNNNLQNLNPDLFSSESGFFGTAQVLHDGKLATFTRHYNFTPRFLMLSDNSFEYKGITGCNSLYVSHKGLSG